MKQGKAMMGRNNIISFVYFVAFLFSGSVMFLPFRAEAASDSKSTNWCNDNFGNGETNKRTDSCNNKDWVTHANEKMYKTDAGTTGDACYCNPNGSGGGLQTYYQHWRWDRIKSCKWDYYEGLIKKKLTQCNYEYYETEIVNMGTRTCSGHVCPPPPAPPPSPPPPSPPPPGSNGVPTVTIGVKSSQVTDREFDFKIKVSDNDCSDSTNCLGTSSAVSTNTAKGLKCDAYVKDITNVAVTCKSGLQIAGSPSDYVPIGSCKGASDFKPTKIQFQGAWIGNLISNSIVKSGADYIAIYQDNAYCKMVKFSVKEQDGQCMYKPLSSGYSSLSAFACSSEEQINAAWNSRTVVNYAWTNGENGYGVNTLYYELCTSGVDDTCSYATAGDHLPCKKWTNFYDSSKADEYKFTLRTTDASGNIKIGTYAVNYNCYWLMPDGVTKAPGTSTGERTLHTFSAKEGCSDWLSSIQVSMEKLFLQSTPSFLSITDCDTINYVKEMAFRKYDTNPQDGKLDYAELLKAFLTHDVDTSYLTNEIGESGYTDLTLSDIMSSNTLPFACYTKAISNSDDVYMTSVTYTDTESDAISTSTTLDSCAAAKELVTVKWGYKNLPTNTADYMCVYSDARLYAKYVGSGGIATSLTDTRPSMGTGDSRVSLIAHFTFDNDLSNSADDEDTTTTLPGSYDSFATCGAGQSCLKTKASSTGFKFSDSNELSESAIMTWIYRSNADTLAKDVIYSTSVTDSSCTHTVHFTMDKDVKLSGGYVVSGNKGGCTTCADGSCQISSSAALPKNKWNHVAMVSNGVYGLNLYANGNSVASLSSWVKTLMDSPFGMTSTSKTLFNSAYLSSSYVYDDARIYTGIVRDLHISSIYECGQSDLCAKRAYASPQSRRTYCIVLNYASSTQGTQGFNPPCVTGLFYNGLVIDLKTSTQTKGVTFSFRDTALAESSFEVLRRQIVDGSAVGSFESIVLIDSDLSGCATTFNSMTFVDSEAARVPGYVWEYAIRTKYPTDSVLNIDSDSYIYTIPWFGIVEGDVHAGESDVAVANVRVCARLKSATTASNISVGTISNLQSDALASFTYVVHSNEEQSGSAFTVTDTFLGTSVAVAETEFLKIDLNIFSSVSSVSVCVESATDLSVAPLFIVRVMDYDDPDDKGTTGNKCIEGAMSAVTNGNVCIEYSCVGTHITSFPGQYITVLSADSTTWNIAEVRVTGSEISCPYSAFSDDDGNFEIEILEEDGLSAKNARAGVLAFKTVVFDRESVSVLEIAADDTVSPPEAVLIALRHGSEKIVALDASKNGLKCQDIGSPFRIFKFLGSDATGAACKSACEDNEECTAFSGIFGEFCVGCSKELDTAHEGTIAYKKTTLLEYNNAAGSEASLGSAAVATATGRKILASAAALGVGLRLPCDSEVDEDGYFLVFRHDSSSGLYFSADNSYAEAKHTGASSKDYKYSRLDEVGTYGKSDDGTYEFKLVYPAYSGWTNIWKQTSNPVTMISRGVEGYEAISIGATSSYTFKGLEYNLGANAFIDGFIDTSTWWFAIGAKAAYRGGIPGPPSTVVKEVKLYVKTTGTAYCTPPPPPPPPPLSPPPPPPHSPPPSPPPPSPFSDSDVDSNDVISKAELAAYALERQDWLDAFIVIPNKFWNTFDVDASGDLNSKEFMNVVSAFHSGHVFGTPWLVYPITETTSLTNFYANDLGTKTGKAAVSAAPNPNATMPITSTAWQTWYDNITSTYSSFSFASPSGSEGTLTDMRLIDMPEFQPARIPLVVRTDDGALMKFAERSVENVQFSGFDSLMSRYFPFEFMDLELRANTQVNDVVHVFNTDDEGYDTIQGETITKISHLSIGGVDMKDNTVVTVSGMVRFPGNRTSEYVCGLPNAIIKAYRQQCADDGSCDYEEADDYTADALGYFEISVTPGETFLFQASYGDHDICYSQDGLDDKCLVKTEATFTLGPSEDEVSTNSYVILESIGGGETIIFYDTTQRTIDLGLYAGGCSGTTYEGYTMLITPANGCGSAIKIADTAIASWLSADDSSNALYWPYAAMDYYIQLDSAPDVSTLSEAKIRADKFSAASCTAPGSNILTFFRDRDELVRTLGFLETAFEMATYQYHGYLCAMPTIGTTSTYTVADEWTAIDAGETCLDSTTATNALTSTHLIGTSSSTTTTVSPTKYAFLTVFEAHCTSLSVSGACVIEYCSTFSSSTNSDLGISVRLKDDVESQSGNICHSSNEPDESCYFTSVDETTKYVQFIDKNTGQLSDYRAIDGSPSSARPNLVSPYRRAVSFTVVRDDGWSTTTTNVDRELITLGSKVRGESADYTARYVSSTTFYATAPIRGLVYTVVHDPPGGDSFASIAHGTNIELELGLLTTRSANVASSWCMDAGVGVGLKTDIGLSAGSGYVNGEFNIRVGDEGKATGAGFSFGIGGGREEDGPSVSVSAETDNGWDFHMTLNRNLDSSLDSSLPGRPGDVILGGGFEIVYVRSDILDLNDSQCLAVTGEITWLPRKPTSYVINIFTIEDKVIPELKNLRNTLRDGSSSSIDITLTADDPAITDAQISGIWASRLDSAISDWTNTIVWTSPDFNPDGTTTAAEKSTAYANAETEFDSIGDTLTSDHGVYGALFKDKIDNANGAYTQNSAKSDYTFAEDWDDLSNVWDTLKDSYGRVSGISGISSAQKMLSESVAENIVDGVSAGSSYGNQGRWKPAAGNWLETYSRTGSETGKNVFNSVEPNTAFSRGMSDLAITDALANGLEPNTKDLYGTAITDETDSSLRTKMQTMDMIDSSIYGASAKFGFDTESDVSEMINSTSVSAIDPASEPNLLSNPATSDANIYLTFSGGGHALEFSTSISSNIDSYGYSWTLEAESQITNNMDTELSGFIAYSNWHFHDTGGKSVALEHAMAWAKYGELETSYTLSDPEHGDKFVIQVKFDKRFGTPIFQTIGGASKCPGEPNTIWREHGLTLRISAADGMNNEAIAPDSSALFDVTITNESPYREGQIFGLLLTSGSSYSGDFSGNMKDLNFIVNGNDKMSPFGDLFNLHDIPSTDDGTMSGNLINSVVSLRIERGAMAHSYESIGLTLISECEWALSRNQIYRSPIQHTAYLGDITWQKKCPPVTWDEGTWNTYANYVASKETSNLFNVTLMNPDPMNLWSMDEIDGDTKGTNHLVHENVEFVRLQFRRPGTGEWISAWEASTMESADLQCSKARGEGCGFKWDLEHQYFLNGLKDGPWEIRSKVFCSGYDSFATSDVRGSVTDENLNMIADVTNPMPLEHKVYYNNLVVDFSESITCPQLDSDTSAYSIARTADCDGNVVVDGTVSSYDILAHYAFRCLTDETNGRNSWTMSIPITKGYANAGEYTVTINDGFIIDDGGNTAAEHSITEFIGCTPSTSSTSTTTRTTTAKASSSAKLGLPKQNMKNQTLLVLADKTPPIVYGIVGAALALFANQLFVHARRRPRRDTFPAMSTANDEHDDEDTEFLVPLNANKRSAYGTSSAHKVV